MALTDYRTGPNPSRNPIIRLTPVTVERDRVVARDAMEVKIQDLLAYSQELGFTRLCLRGGRALDVSEGTEDIDRLVRSAVIAPLPVAR